MTKRDDELLQTASDVALLAYNPDQKRDDRGRWGEGGGAGNGESLARTPEGRAAEVAATPADHTRAAAYHANREKALRGKRDKAEARKFHDAAVEAHLKAVDAAGTHDFDRLSARANIASDMAHAAEHGG